MRFWRDLFYAAATGAIIGTVIRQRRAELMEQLVQCQQALAAALQENRILRQKVNLLVRRVSGSSSGNLDSAQLELLQLRLRMGTRTYLTHLLYWAKRL